MGALWQLIEEYRDAQTYRPSVNQVAARAGLGRSTVNRWQKISKLPDREHLEAVARVIGRPYAVVLEAALRDIGYLSESEARRDAAPMTPPHLSVSHDGEADVVDVKPRTQSARKSTKRHPSR